MAGSRLPGPTREASARPDAGTLARSAVPAAGTLGRIQRPSLAPASSASPLFHRILPGPARLADSWGHGHFGRSRGTRTHRGLDIVSVPGEVVSSPIAGTITRESLPYPDDTSYRGLLISGTGAWAGYEIKMFYVTGLSSGNVTAGAPVGLAQDLGRRYPGVTNHVHVEVRYHGWVLNPMDMFGLCF